MNEEVNTISTVKIPHIILNSDTIEDNKADKVMIEAKVDNACVLNTIWGRGVYCSLDKSRMVEFASTGLFIVFGFHLCSLIMILFCFFIIFWNILFGNKAIFFLLHMIVAVTFISSGEVLGFLFKYFCSFSIDTNSYWHRQPQ